MQQAYEELHKLGHAVSYEVWEDNKLVGGLYGIDLGVVFCGESMFSLVPNASKAAFVEMVRDLGNRNYRCVDCQVYSEHLGSLGAEEIPRADFMDLLTGSQ
jgi:leucyl/phenylalanyl-tRNA--protein transferase